MSLGSFGSRVTAGIFFATMCSCGGATTGLGGAGSASGVGNHGGGSGSIAGVSGSGSGLGSGAGAGAGAGESTGAATGATVVAISGDGVASGATSGASSGATSGSALGDDGGPDADGGGLTAQMEAEAYDDPADPPFLSEAYCNANAPAVPVVGGARCTFTGAQACGYHDCSDVSVAHLCTCTGGAWECGRCGPCPQYTLLGAATGVGAVCESPTLAVQCDGTTAVVPSSGCRAPDGSWICSGVATKICDPNAGAFAGDFRTRYATLLCGAIGRCRDGGGYPLGAAPSTDEIQSCIIPVLQKIASSALAGTAAMQGLCTMDLTVAPTKDVPCSDLSIDSPPAICSGVFR